MSRAETRRQDLLVDLLRGTVRPGRAPELVGLFVVERADAREGPVEAVGVAVERSTSAMFESQSATWASRRIRSTFSPASRPRPIRSWRRSSRSTGPETDLLLVEQRTEVGQELGAIRGALVPLLGLVLGGTGDRRVLPDDGFIDHRGEFGFGASASTR